MRTFTRSLSVALAVCSLVAANDACAQWGTLKGRVVVTGEAPDVPLLHPKGDTQVKEPLCRAHDIADESLVIDEETQGLANVFVFLQRAPNEIHPELKAPAELTFDQKNCPFLPHAMVVQPGQTVWLGFIGGTTSGNATMPMTVSLDGVECTADL